MTEHNEKTDNSRLFLKKIEELGKGEKTALKRSLGQSLANADGAAVAAFYRALPVTLSHREEEVFFLTSTCICFWKDADMQSRSFIACLSSIGREMDSMDRRVIALLDTEWNAYDGYFIGKISRLIRMVKQKGLKPDFTKLLEDLLLWTLPERPIQRRWARAYFGEKEK